MQEAEKAGPLGALPSPPTASSTSTMDKSVADKKKTKKLYNSGSFPSPDAETKAAKKKAKRRTVHVATKANRSSKSVVIRPPHQQTNGLALVEPNESEEKKTQSNNSQRPRRRRSLEDTSSGRSVAWGDDGDKEDVIIDSGIWKSANQKKKTVKKRKKQQRQKQKNKEDEEDVDGDDEQEDEEDVVDLDGLLAELQTSQEAVRLLKQKITKLSSSGHRTQQQCQEKLQRLYLEQQRQLQMQNGLSSAIVSHEENGVSEEKEKEKEKVKEEKKTKQRKTPLHIASPSPVQTPRTTTIMTMQQTEEAAMEVDSVAMEDVSYPWQVLKGFIEQKVCQMEQEGTCGGPPDAVCVAAIIDFRRAMTPKLKSRQYHQMKHHYTFTGREAVDFIVSRMGVSRGTAVFIGNKMMQSRVFRHVTNSYTFCDEPGKYYCFAKPENSALHLPQPLTPFVGHIIIETLMLEPSCPKDALFTVVCDNQKFKIKAIGRPTEEQQSPKATTKNRKKKPAVTKEDDDTSSTKKRSGSRISAQRNKLVNTIKLRKTSRANNNNRASTIQVLERQNAEETINKNEKANKRKAAADALVQSFAQLTSSPTFQDTLRSYLLLSWGDTVYGEEVERDEDDNKKRTEKNFFSKAEEQKLAEMVAPWLLNNQQNKTNKRLRLKKPQSYREKKQSKEDGDKEENIMVRSYEEQRPHIKASQSLSLPTLPLLSAGTRTPTTPPNTSDDDEDGEDFKEDDVVVMNVEFNAHGENGDDVETENFCSVLSDNKREETGEVGGEQEEAEENRTSTDEDLSSSSASSTQTSQENVEERLSSPTLQRNADDSNGKIRKGQKTSSSSSSPPASPSSDSITDLHMIVFWPNSELTVSFQCSSHASGKVHIPLSDLKNNGELQELRLPITTTRRKSVDVGTSSSASSFSSSSGSLSPTTTFSNSTDSTENQPTLLIRLRYTHNATDDGFALPPLPFDNYSVQLRTESRLTRYNVFKTAGHRPNHRCCDRNNVFPVLDELEEPYPADKLASANGVFWYGIGSLTNANVELFVQEDFRKEDWTWIGSGQTDKRGKVVIPIPPDASSIQRKPGHYPVRMVVPKDRSVAAGSLWILRKGTGAVVFDIDGTLTTGDIQVVTQTGLNLISVNFDPTPQSGAVALVRAWAAKGYLPIYLSGRAGAFYKLTRNWLIEHGLPPGLIGHTETHKPTVPLWASVGRFKRDYIRDLIDKYGLQIGGVYGNTKTDIKAYEQMGMAKDKTFICGKFGGRKGTVDVGNDFNAHIKYVMENIPPATIPAPLSWTSY